MEREIGEIFEYNGEWYQCLISNCCRECDFSSNNITCDIHGTLICTCKGRSDETSVVFKKLEKVGEPFTCIILGNIIYQQRYKLYEPMTTLEGYWYSIDGEFINIEIKQNKEDMEDNKLNLKPFDIQKAREGKPVCTRDGRKARIVCFDAKGIQPIVALVTCGTEEKSVRYKISGRFRFDGTPDGADLMMLPEKHEGWTNIYKTAIRHECGAVFDTEKEARDHADDGCVATINIEWEE